MLKRIIAFFKSRPTEFWLGLWAVIVSVATAFGFDLEATVVTAVAAVVGWLTTWLASQESNSLGPK